MMTTAQCGTFRARIQNAIAALSNFLMPGCVEISIHCGICHQEVVRGNEIPHLEYFHPEEM